MTDRPAPSEAVLEAVVAVIADEGLEGTSVRRVAARAGVSIGAVQHHFPTKDAMLAAAMARVEDVHRRRLLQEAALLPDEPGARLRATLRSLVPTTERERRETSLWLAFVARAAVHEQTAAQHRRIWQRAEDGIAWLVASCDPTRPGTGPGPDDTGPGDTGSPEAEAEAVAEPGPWARDVAADLLALADGLAVAALLEPARMPAERARRLVDAAVDAVLARTGRAGAQMPSSSRRSRSHPR